MATALYPAASGSDEFTSLEVIKRPGPRVMLADSFTDQRVLWLFPYLNFSQSRTITGWAFRAQPSNPTRSPASPNRPVFQLWQEMAATNVLDYRCINCSNADVGQVEPNFMETNSVYKQTLESPLVVTPNNHYILGILLPSPQENHLNLAFQNNENESAGRLSYFFDTDTAFVVIRNETYRDNLHIPLVTPLYGKIAIPHGSMYSSMLHVFFQRYTSGADSATCYHRNTNITFSPHICRFVCMQSLEAWLEAQFVYLVSLFHDKQHEFRVIPHHLSTYTNRYSRSN